MLRPPQSYTEFTMTVWQWLKQHCAIVIKNTGKEVELRNPNHFNRNVYSD